MSNAPPESTNTSTGALPPCVAAKASSVLTALPARSQSVGVLNSAAIIITAGSRGGGLLTNHPRQIHQLVTVVEIRRRSGNGHRHHNTVNRHHTLELHRGNGGPVSLIRQRTPGQLIPGSGNGREVPHPPIDRQRATEQTQRYRQHRQPTPPPACTAPTNAHDPQSPAAQPNPDPHPSRRRTSGYPRRLHIPARADRQHHPDDQRHR